MISLGTTPSVFVLLFCLPTHTHWNSPFLSQEVVTVSHNEALAALRDIGLKVNGGASEKSSKEKEEEEEEESE